MFGKFQRCLVLTCSCLLLPVLLQAESGKIIVNGFVIEEIDKQDIQGLRNKAMGDLLFHRGSLAEAIKYYEKAAKFIPNEADVYFRLGEIYFQNKIYKLALSYYDLALQKYAYPENAGKSGKNRYLILAHQGTILYNTDKIDEAIEKRMLIVRDKRLIQRDYPELKDEMLRFFILTLGEELGRSEWTK